MSRLALGARVLRAHRCGFVAQRLRQQLELDDFEFLELTKIP